ncbi:hypothetical protein DH2020_037091 [Rehmannia glutinosa]|uniref:Leucine-rich repeat-containing N-terminal plant-type domain-containing protein n=1 Tax=Rehmannia glutinosa TaxID=99300 RepID=A0ABR0V1X4_REHGL
MGRFSFIMKWHHLHKPLKLLLFICVLISAQNDVVSASDSDKSALLEFKQSLSDPYGVLSSWGLQNPDHCSWVGVSCDSGSRVVALNVTGGAVAKLSELKILSLPFNELSDEIPVEIWGMVNLEVLDLEGNLISGSLPAQFSGLKNLKVLNLGFNEIFGVIPGSLSNCVGLEILNLAGNQVNGSIPGYFGGFRDLRGLYLSFNLLSGSIPIELGDNCGSLEHLDLSGNYLIDGIPKSIGKCRGLKTLLLYSNMLEEVLPSELGQLSQLEVLDVSRNSFGGPIPPELGNCTKLSVLVLSNLWDPLPNISSLVGGYSEEKLAFTADEYNFYAGTIPMGITSLSSLRMVWAPRATLEGSFPESWGSCDNLEILNLAQNYFSGKISEGFSNCKKVHFLDLSSNRLGGEINDEIHVPCMTLFDISGNYFSGSIPKFNYEACSPIRFMNGDFSDPSSAYITYFGYRTTQIETSLPFHGETGSFLVLHNFGSNNLTGPLQSMPVAPERLGKQTVYAFLAGRNRLTGSLSGVFFEKCDQARGIIVNVTNNVLFGQIPTDIATMCKTLTLLDTSSNQIAGNIPPSFGDLVSLLVLDLSWNRFQGPIPNSLSRIKDLKSLSLAGNNLNGSIPGSLGQLYSLEILDLSSNSLSGEIPNDLANLRNLTVLLLNNNKLSGQLPPGVANISTLSTFNASFNYLSGTLSLNNTMIKCNSFLGNPSLHCPVFSSSPPYTDRQGRVGDTQNNASTPSSPPSRKSAHDGLDSIRIASITSAAAIASVILALIVLFFYIRKCKSRSRVSTTVRKEVIVFTDIGVPLTFENVVRATGSFNASNCIGNGGFGATYKAEIAPGVLVAIKRLAVGRFLELRNSRDDRCGGTRRICRSEYAMTCRVSDKADVYSYGVVLLELLSDKKALDPSFSPYGNGFNIVAWACMLLRQGRAKEFFTAGLWDAGPHDDLVEVLHLAVVCTVDSLSTRPTMKQVVRRLKQLQPPSC